MGKKIEAATVVRLCHEEYLTCLLSLRCLLSVLVYLYRDTKSAPLSLVWLPCCVSVTEMFWRWVGGSRGLAGGRGRTVDQKSVGSFALLGLATGPQCFCPGGLQETKLGLEVK